jgi:hypothetical protein
MMNIDHQLACRSIPQQGGDRSTVASKQKFRVALAAALALASFSEFASAQVLPPDVKPTCTFGPTEFADWFETGTVTARGAVKPANSATFTPGPDCDYYKWASRMFLWLTSPAPGGGLTFESPEFYGVSALVDGKRTLTKNTGGKVDFFSLRASKPVEHGGQPGTRGVLMGRNGSLVYYASQVNEAFALFLTGVKSREFTPSWGSPLEFPTEQDHVDEIVRYASDRRRVQIRNASALTVEVKSAWIEATGLDTSKYITMNATVPTFDKTASTWTPNGPSRQYWPWLACMSSGV